MRFWYVIGRIAHPFAEIAFFIHQRIFNQPRARVLVWNEHGELLLVQNWSGHKQWGLPGGGINKHEPADVAARREIYEETGIDSPLERYEYVTTVTDKYTAPIYQLTVSSEDLPKRPHNPWEITALQWFSPSQLPHDLSPIVTQALDTIPKTD